MCEVAGWMPCAGALRGDRSAQPVVQWLAALRAHVEEYDAPRAPSPRSATPDSAFDEILSQLGKEIFQLDEYHRNLVPGDGEISLSILNIFDECLVEMTESPDGGDGSETDTSFVSSTPSEVKMHLDGDSQSTRWNYLDCSGDEGDSNAYSTLWSQSSGFHNSDAIMERVLRQHRAVVSRVSYHRAANLPPQEYPVYALREDRPVGDMTPPDDGVYEPVRDAITDDHIYEELEYSHNFTDEGCSSAGSVEICSNSASSDRESPLYVNLRDNDAYAIPSNVIFWKNMLLDPYYNDDEEDEWITPEECAVYSTEQRPPLVIPRITQYRVPRRELRPHLAHPYTEDEPPSPISSVRHHDHLQNWSPTSDRSRADSDSPPFTRINKRLGGSTENLLQAHHRRPNYLQIPASSSGDSLDKDVEVRGREPAYGRNRKSRSMMAHKDRMRSPVPAPRMLPPQTAEGVLTICFEGHVKRTKFSESGKKCKKHWTECYMVLTTTALVFYKDQRTYFASRMPKPPGTPPSPSAPRAELVLPMHNAHVVHCIQMHTKRYTKSLVLTVGYDQYLLQDDTEEGARRWMACIQNVIYKLGPPKLDEFPKQYQSSNTDLESLGRTPPVSRHSNRSKQKVGGSSNEDLSETETSIQKVRVATKLRKFFIMRPTKESLTQKGIYQDEPVFGRNLEDVCPKTAPLVPEFVVACVREIESNEENMCTDGLYRASGNLSQVQKVRLQVDQNNTKVIKDSTDIHVLTGSLKLFFRELKEPLIPCNMFDRVLKACSIKPKEAKIKEFREIVQALPQCNRETLKFLLEHLLRVTQYSERNRMHTANLAIVFGPTLLWAPAEQAHNIAIDCIQQNNVVEVLLNDYKEIFAEDSKVKKKA